MGTRKTTPKKAHKTTGKAQEKKRDKDMKWVKNAQTWSIDLIMGVIIFMLVIAIFYAFLSSKGSEPIKDLEADARATDTKVTGKQLASLGVITEEGAIDKSEFDQLCQENYEDVKKSLGIENDVCIYLEDEDGNIIPCGPDKAGIGNGEDIRVTEDTPCGGAFS
ncbi:MAG: hypothetical protein ACLFO2_02925 [Candidatus Woesearchaeota archaeon]